MRFLIFCYVLVLAACAPVAPPPNTAASPGAQTYSEQPRINMTRQQCQQAGGTEIGDIGDGRIHRPDYRCENGKPPIAAIISVEGEPVAIEGSVCCSLEK